MMIAGGILVCLYPCVLVPTFLLGLFLAGARSFKSHTVSEKSNFPKDDVLVCFGCCCDKCHGPKQLRTGKGLFHLIL